MPELLIVLSTFPDEPTARQIGTTLVERNLAACVNIIPTIYRWQRQNPHQEGNFHHNLLLSINFPAQDNYGALGTPMP